MTVLADSQRCNYPLSIPHLIYLYWKNKNWDAPRKSKRKRRKAAQQQHQQQTNQSTVVELFPQNATIDDQLISSEISQSNLEQTQPVVEPSDDSSNKQIPPKKIVAYDWNQLMEENW